MFINDVKNDLSMANILKDNKMNLPLLASFVSLCSSTGQIYTAITQRDGMGIIVGMRDVGLLVILTFVRTGQFGLKTIADLGNLFGGGLLGRLLGGYKDLNLVFEKIASRISGGASHGLKKSLKESKSSTKKYFN